MQSENSVLKALVCVKLRSPCVGKTNRRPALEFRSMGSPRVRENYHKNHDIRY